MKKIFLKHSFRVISIIMFGLLFIASRSKAYSCGSDEDGYVCCGTYHTYGHSQYLMTLEGNKKGTRFVSIDTGFSDSEETTITNAIDMWNTKMRSVQLNALYLTKMSNNSQIIIKCATLEKGVCGYTRFFKKTGGGELKTDKKGKLLERYGRSIVYIDIAKGKLKRVVSHELGHAIGLSHRVCNTKSIMYNYMNSIDVTTPQIIDANSVKHIYQ